MVASRSCADRAFRLHVLDGHAVEVRTHHPDALLEHTRVAIGRIMLHCAALRSGPRESVEREAAGETMRAAPEVRTVALRKRDRHLIKKRAPRGKKVGHRRFEI